MCSRRRRRDFHDRVAIVGAGPAGIAAARVLAAHGVAPVVIDEAQRPGGQIYRQPRPGLRLDIEGLLGAEAENYRRTHAAFDALRDRIDYRPQTLAWAVDDRDAPHDRAAMKPPRSSSTR